VFLNSVHGKTNNLLRAVALDVTEPLYLAGITAFGLISQYISAPLWRLLEAPGHILEMNSTFKILTDFLHKAADNVEVTKMFTRGEETPFEEIV